MSGDWQFKRASASQASMVKQNVDANVCYDGSYEDMRSVFEEAMFPAEIVSKASVPTWQVGQVGWMIFAPVQWICGWKGKARDKESDKGQCTTETVLDMYCNDERERANTIRLQERQTNAEGKGIKGKKIQERMFKWWEADLGMDRFGRGSTSTVDYARNAR